MAVLSPQPKMQFTTAAGVPLSGGKLYTYIAGTTTPQATFTDSTNATPNTNPVILDSRGEANIWLGAATYKFKLTDANDVEIWTVDYISAPTSGISPVLSGNVVIDSDTPGPALKITQTGTGPVLRVQDSTDPDTTPFIIDNAGNVGIGTAVPTAQLEATGAAKIGSLTLTSSPLPVASGGTGLATLTANNVLIGAGTGNVTFVAPGANGNVLTSNGTVWQSQTPSAVAGTLLNVQVFTSSGTYTRTSGATRAVVIAVGGGGGGAGALGNGGSGGTTSFGSHVSAAGGGGAVNGGAPGAGGTGGTGATIAIQGQAGQGGFMIITDGCGNQIRGGGGGGGQGGGRGNSTGSANATAGIRGGGGGGGYATNPSVCGGGGQGETAIDYITSGLNATETVTIGGGGSAGSGTGSGAGAAGGAGYIIVYEYS